MKLIVIHGAPATGKMTVARELASFTKFPFVDNHIAIDLARNIFGSATSGFWDLVHDVRVATIRGAARAEVPLLITTAAYSHPDDLPLLEDYENAVSEFNGTVSYVYLFCSETTLMHRISSVSRVERGKMSSKAELSKYLEKKNNIAVPQDDCIHLSTEDTSPRENAEKIARHYKLIKPS